MGERRSRGENIRKLEQVARSQQPPLTLSQFLVQEYAFKSDAVIAEETGVPKYTIFRLRRQLGIPSHTRGDLFQKNISPEREIQMREQGRALGARRNKIAFSETANVGEGLRRRLHQGASWEAIAQEAGVSVPTIKSRVQRLEIPHPFPSGGEKRKIAAITALQPTVTNYYQLDNFQRLETSPDEELRLGAAILRERYLVDDPRKGKSWQELSQTLGYSPPKIRQIQKKALAVYEKA